MWALSSFSSRKWHVFRIETKLGFSFIISNQNDIKTAQKRAVFYLQRLKTSFALTAGSSGFTGVTSSPMLLSHVN